MDQTELPNAAAPPDHSAGFDHLAGALLRVASPAW